MIMYVIGILPLFNNLKREIPDVTHTLYADDAGALGIFVRIETYFNLLTRQGPGRGHYPKPSKSILIMRPDNIGTIKEFGARHGFKLCTGARYLRGCIGDNKPKRDWLRERTLTWENNVRTISETAVKYPQ